MNLRSGRLAAAVCVSMLSVASLVGPRPSLAQPAGSGFSGLVGQELVQDQGEAAGLLGDLLLSRHKGRITKVVVREDQERVLGLDVTYADADLSKPKVLTGSVEDAGGHAQPVSALNIPLTAAAGTLRFQMQLRPDLPEATAFESRRLTLRIRSASDARYDTGGVFALSKRWAVAVRPENLVVDVQPVAIGTIPNSDPTPVGTPVPPRILRPETMIMLSRPLMIAPAVPAATPTPAPPPPRPYGRPPIAPRAVTLSPAVLASFRALPPVSASAGLPAAVTDQGGKGPSSQAIRIFDTLRTAPGVQLTADKLTSINADLYRDANPASGIFYYLPARYTLYWDADNGYALRFLYGAATPDSGGSVSVTARLTSGIDSQELELLKSLLRTSLPAGVFKELKPLPFSGTPAFSFKDDLRRFNIPAEKISISAISDLAGEVDLAFVTDVVTKDMIELTLTQGLGLTGTATFTSASASGTDGFSRTIPVQLRCADPRSFGTVYWRRGEMVRNSAPFPLLLKQLHFLTVAQDGTPTVYSYALGNAELAPQARARVADTAVQSWLDHRALRTWVEYTVREDYPAGIEKAKSDWNGGLGQLSTTEVKFTTLTPFTDPGHMARLLVDVKSRYFSPQANADVVRSVALTHDNESTTVGPVFLINRSAEEVSKPGDPLFSYRLSLVTPDGAVAGPGSWTDGDRLEIFLGSRQVRTVMGDPGPTPSPTPTPTP